MRIVGAETACNVNGVLTKPDGTIRLTEFSQSAREIVKIDPNAIGVSALAVDLQGAFMTGNRTLGFAQNVQGRSEITEPHSL